MHTGIKDDDTLHCRTQREDTTSLVVLVLFAHKEITNLRIVHHKLNLLFRTGGIERDGHGTDTPGAEVALDILHRIIGENTDILLHLHAEIQQGIRHLFDGLRHLIPGQRFPFLSTEILIDQHLAIAILLCLFVHQH